MGQRHRRLVAAAAYCIWLLTVATLASGQAELDVAELHRTADQGDAAAQANLGFLYASGRGVPQDYGEAVRWYRLAADQGNGNAQYNLGFLYANGRGVPQDYGEAVGWYRLAADQGHAFAQGSLGEMYADGRGVPQDYGEAVRWYRLAADQGDAFAQANLGIMYDFGGGVRQDYGEAARWYRLAADQGNAFAQYSLGCQATLKTDPPATSKTDPRRNGVCRSTSGDSPRSVSTVDGRAAPSRPGRKAHNCHPSRGADGVSPDRAVASRRTCAAR